MSEPDYDEWDDGCQECDDGMIIVCPDDMCRGCGGCGNFDDKSCYRVCSCQSAPPEQEVESSG